jgi:hypothetical protein
MSKGGIVPKIGFVAMLVTVSAALCWAVEPYSIESIKISSTSSVPKNIVDDLDPQGLLLSTFENGIKEPICEIFLAKTTPAVAVAHPATDNGYASISQGALVGLIHLLPEATEDYYEDFSNQKLKPGYYTMRYAVLPAGIGEHGPVPGDFVVLSPITQDQDPLRTLGFDEMVRLGKLASHGEEAARMQLVQPEKTKNPLPDVSVDSSGVATLHFKLHLTGAKVDPQGLELALVVVTPIPKDSNASS